MGETQTGRTVGPVTMATGYSVAVAGVLCWVLSLFGINVPPEVQGFISVLVVLVAGYAVPPAGTGRRRA